jgi:hypothetical protein
MVTCAHIPLGAPGVFFRPDEPLRTLTGIRMDVCAFVGVAPRGPARVPVVNEKWRDDRPCVEPGRPRQRTVAVAVESFDAYKHLYGGFEGPGLLPYAVAAFFEQGGQRAYIARIVHEYGPVTDGNAAGVAFGDVSNVQTSAGPLRLVARNEGTWGNHLRVILSFSSQPLHFVSSTQTSLTLTSNTKLPAGTLVRLTLPSGLRAMRLIASAVEQGHAQQPESILQVTFDQAITEVPEAAEVIEGTLIVADGTGQTERHGQLGLSSLHPRWMATVLCYESELIYPDASWIHADIVLENETLNGFTTHVATLQHGEDRYADITPEDFFDPFWTFDNGEPGDGVQSLVHLSDLSLLAVPDLYSPAPLVPAEPIVDPISLAGPTFAPCVDLPQPPPIQEVVAHDLEGLRLDPRLPADLNTITLLQQRLAEFADHLRSFVVLLDVPPGLHDRQILAWRQPFNTSYAAAYHPWLTVARRDDSRDTLIRVPPSAIAAGIIAQQERTFGVPTGPANVIAAEVIDVDARVSPAQHDELHPLGINVYLQERDGVRLSAARTLSRDRAYRQLSVRRLVMLIRRTVERQMQWTVFEPNNAALRAEVRHLLLGYLRQLFLAGAFRGATEEEAFFVRCDDTLNPPYIIEAGRLIAEIGIAPSEPIEFIVVQLARDGDGTLSVQDQRLSQVAG